VGRLDRSNWRAAASFGIKQLVVAAALLVAGAAQAARIGEQVFAIEAAHGDKPAEVIQRLAPLEAAAAAPRATTCASSWPPGVMRTR
jgi:hypothetical protein